MQMSVLFWVCMLLMLIGGAWEYRGGPRWVGGILLFIVLALLGWQVFGSAVR